MSDESVHLTDNLRRLREVRGLSQAQISRLAGVPRATWRLDAGDVVVFRGNQKHQYFNPGKVEAVAYSVLAFAPVAS